MQLVQPSAGTPGQENGQQREETTVPERRESERWTSPRIILTLVQVCIGAASLITAVLGLIVVVLGIIFGAYLLSQKNDVTSEMSNASLSSGFEKLGQKVDRLGDEFRATAAKAGETDSKVMMNARDIEREMATRASETGLLNARIIAAEKDLERLKATR